MFLIVIGMLGVIVKLEMLFDSFSPQDSYFGFFTSPTLVASNSNHLEDIILYFSSCSLELL